jgi:hypothetical protein
MIKNLRINKKDNVVVALGYIKKGEIFDMEGTPFVAKENINFGHKIALTDIFKDEKVVKYGEVIGYAIQNIKKGTWVHVHNLQSNRGRLKGGKVNTNEI